MGSDGMGDLKRLEKCMEIVYWEWKGKGLSRIKVYKRMENIN